MNVRQAVNASLDLLSKRDRRILSLVTVAQMSTSFLDLAGVFLIGMVTAISVSFISDTPVPPQIQSVLDAAGLTNGDLSSLAGLMALIAGICLIAKSILSALLTRRIMFFLANRQAMVSGKLSADLLSRPLTQVQRRSSQDTVYSLTDGVYAATFLILGQGIIAVSEATLLIVLTIGLMFVSPTVTLFSILFFLTLAFLLQRILAGWASRLGATHSSIGIASISAVQEALRTYREVFVSHRRGFYVDRFQGLRWKYASMQANMSFITLIPKYVFEVALIVGAAMLAYSQFLTKDVTSAITTIVVFLAAGSRVVPSMLRLQSAAIIVRMAAGQAAPTFSLVKELADSKSLSVQGEESKNVEARDNLGPRGNVHTDFMPEISLTNVNFTYPDSSIPALVDVNLELASGSSLALVGASGAGKSTLVDTILGVIAPDSGSVQVGRMDPRRAVARWPGAMSYVPQEVAMVNGTIRENVALGLPPELIDDDCVWNSLKRARMADFLLDCRDGLNTMVGEDGVKLSGGQRQRLGIARALYSNPQLLVLDEATSALDADTEHAISLTLQELHGEVTTVTIAHRLATIRHCDQVIFMSSGRVVASGTFDQVRLAVKDFDRQAKILGL